MDIKMFNEELADYDLFVESIPEFDWEVDRNGDLSMVRNPQIKYWIENISDPSVGIFANILSPLFDSVDELYLYWQEHKAEILGDDEVEEVIPQNSIPHQAPRSSQIYRAY